MRSEEEKRSVRKEIEERIDQTQKSIERLREQSRPVAPDSAIGRITRMDAIQQKSMAEANLRSAEETLMLLEEALTKFEDPSFGVCVKCHKAIPVGRILAVPEARCCVACA